MPQLGERDRRRIGELRSWLDGIGDGGEAVLGSVVEELRELWGAQKTCAYGVSRGESSLRVDHFVVAGAHFAGGEMARDLDGVLTASPADWALYNPLVVQPNQRNVAVSLNDLARMTGRREAQISIRLWRKWDLHACDQLRAVVCDGPVMMTWIGGFRRNAFTAREKMILANLVPPLERRLRLERQLGFAALTSGAITAALETISAPAFIVGSGGRVKHANSAGRTHLALRGMGSVIEMNEQFRVTELSTSGAAKFHLAVLREERPEAAARVAAAKAKWNLTPRQAEVLGLVVHGHANKTIAAIPGCVENTVEVHVSTLLEKTQTEGRCALVAKFWTTSF